MNVLYPLFLAGVRATGLIRAGDTVVLGFSGGKDSLTLCLLLARLQQDLPGRLVLAYLNHGLRADSAAEEAWVRRFATDRGFDLRVGQRRVAERARNEGLNLEHAASLSRYEFFDRVAAEFPGARIATAHTRSDLAETFLLKLLRGSGLQGLSAIYQSKERRLIRPLLLFSQAEVDAFLLRMGLAPYQDPSNLGDDFLRNRLRHTVMPALRAAEPTCEERIYTTVQLVQDEFEYFQQRARRFLSRHLLAGAVLATPPLRRQPAAMQRHIVREYIRGIKGNLHHVGFAHVEAIRRALGSTAAIAVPGLPLASSPFFLYPQCLALSGHERVIAGCGLVPLGIGALAVKIELLERFAKPAGNDVLVTSLRRLPFPFTVRSVRPGDKYVKINAPYRQAVQEMVRSAGFPVALRPLAPLVVAGDGHIAWVYGAPLASAFAVGAGEEGPFVKISLTGLPEGFLLPASPRRRRS